MENEKNQATKECPKCGEKILKVAKKCKHCGSRIQGTSALTVVVAFIFLIVIVLSFSSMVKNIEKDIDDGLEKVIGTNNNSFKHTDIEKLKVEAKDFEYDDLARFPEKYQDKYLHFTGEVIQKTDNILRINVTKGKYNSWDDTVYVILKDNKVRILEDDIVEMWGIADGQQSYIAVLGNKITIPKINVYAAEVLEKQAK